MGELSGTRHHRHTVLVVDDDEQIIKSLAKVLSRDGYQIVTATNAVAALQCLQQTLPCIALLDIAMPGMDGLELCRRITQDPRIADIPIALVTGQLETADVEAGLAAGAVDYIKKPFDPDELCVRVRTQIRLGETLRAQRLAEKHLLLFSEAAKDAIIVIDDDGAITNWNAAASEMFGYAEGEVVGRNLHELIAPKRFHAAHVRAFSQFRDTGHGGAIGRIVELEALRKTGEEFPVELSLSAANIEGSWSAIGIVRDITDRKQFETALRQSEEEYKLLYQASQDALMTLSPPTWKFTRCNDATVKLFGATSQEQFTLLGPWNVSPEYQPDGRLSVDAAQEKIAQAMTDGVASFAWTHRRLDGEDIACEVLLTRIGRGDQTYLQATVRDVTQRMRIEAALQASEARYRTSFEDASVGQMLATRDGRFIEVNKALADMLGYGVSELRDKRFTEITHPDDRTKSLDAWAQLLGGQRSHRHEKRYVSKDGTTTWVDVNVAALRDQRGEVTHFVVQVIDISERTRMHDLLSKEQEALRLSEQFARSTVDALSSHIAILDEHGVIITVNAAWRAFAADNPPFRDNVNEGANYIAVCDAAQGQFAEGAAEFAAGIRQVLGGERDVFEMEYPCSSPTEKRWFLGRVTRYPDENVRRAVVAHTNITARKLAEEAARQGEQFLHKLLNALPMPVFYKNTVGCYLGVNKAYLNFFGLEQQDIVGKTVFDVFPVELASYYRDKDQELLSQQGTQVYGTQVRHCDGTVRDVIFHKATFDDSSGLLAGIIGVIFDVTDRKRAEEELSHARKLEAVGQLAAGIAHEINTPAQYVGDGVYFLKEVFDSLQQLMTEWRNAVERLEEAGTHSELVDRIRQLEDELDLGYIDANVPGTFDRCMDGISRISTIVRAMKEFSHPDQREKSPADLNQALANTLIIARNEYKYIAEVETEFGELPAVMCHLGDLNQVFLNLIVNATHAIGDVVDKEVEKGLISISTHMDGPDAVIDIADTGAGIPVSIRDRIFEPFFTTKQVGKGSGQGLAIARSIIVDKHCGTLTFDSEVGHGTTFTIRLPVAGKRGTNGEKPL